MGGWSTIDTLYPNTFSSQTYDDTGLSENSSYSYELVATGPGGTSGAASTSGATLPAAPSSLTATDNGTYMVNLDWTDNSSSTSFEIDRSIGGGSFSALSSPSIFYNSLTHTYFCTDSVPDDSSCAYEVYALGTGNSSDASNTAYATTPFAEPTGLGTSIVSAGEIDVSWTSNSSVNPVDYQLERSTNGGSYSVLSTSIAGYPSSTVTYGNGNRIGGQGGRRIGGHLLSKNSPVRGHVKHASLDSHIITWLLPWLHPLPLLSDSA